MPFSTKIGFLDHFWQTGSVAFFWSDQKTKSDYFVKTINFHFLSKLFWWLEKWATVIAQNYFGKFCYCVPGWKVSKHWFLEPLGGSLAPCDSLLLWTRIFIQIHSGTLWVIILESLIQRFFDTFPLLLLNMLFVLTCGIRSWSGSRSRSRSCYWRTYIASFLTVFYDFLGLFTLLLTFCLWPCVLTVGRTTYFAGVWTFFKDCCFLFTLLFALLFIPFIFTSHWIFIFCKKIYIFW